MTGNRGTREGHEYGDKMDDLEQGKAILTDVTIEDLGYVLESSDIIKDVSKSNDNIQRLNIEQLYNNSGFGDSVVPGIYNTNRICGNNVKVNNNNSRIEFSNQHNNAFEISAANKLQYVQNKHSNNNTGLNSNYKRNSSNIKVQYTQKNNQFPSDTPNIYTIERPYNSLITRLPIPKRHTRNLHYSPYNISPSFTPHYSSGNAQMARGLTSHYYTNNQNWSQKMCLLLRPPPPPPPPPRLPPPPYSYPHRIRTQIHIRNTHAEPIRIYPFSRYEQLHNQANNICDPNSIGFQHTTNNNSLEHFNPNSRNNLKPVIYVNNYPTLQKLLGKAPVLPKLHKNITSLMPIKFSEPQLKVPSVTKLAQSMIHCNKSNKPISREIKKDQTASKTTSLETSKAKTTKSIINSNKPTHTFSKPDPLIMKDTKVLKLNQSISKSEENEGKVVNLVSVQNITKPNQLMAKVKKLVPSEHGASKELQIPMQKYMTPSQFLPKIVKSTETFTNLSNSKVMKATKTILNIAQFNQNLKYSPPILPIPTYIEALEFFERNKYKMVYCNISKQNRKINKEMNNKDLKKKSLDEYHQRPFTTTVVSKMGKPLLN